MNTTPPDYAQSFPPLEGSHAHTLILGTMPGQASLSATEYYAHPRNTFWPIMMAIIDQQAPSYDTMTATTYTFRCSQLLANGYALWDVLSHCRRPGSLDSHIVRSSEQANDIAGLIDRHPELHTVACNGKTAEKLLRRHCQSSLTQRHHQGRSIRLISLPSSSPAMASLSLAEKHHLWETGLLG